MKSKTGEVNKEFQARHLSKAIIPFSCSQDSNMNRAEKIALLQEKESERESHLIEYYATKHTVFLCDGCGFRITVIEKPEPYIGISVVTRCYYEDRVEGLSSERKSLRNRNGPFFSCRGQGNAVCTGCGYPLFIKEGEHPGKCEKCGGVELVFWRSLPSKKCPDCNEPFGDGKIFDNWDEFTDWEIATELEGKAKVRRKFGLADPEPTKVMSFREERRSTENKIRVAHYTDERYVLNSPNNVIRFFYSAPYPGMVFYCIIAEWRKADDGGTLICCEGGEKCATSRLEKAQIEQLLSLLEKHRFFTEPHENERFGCDGSDWTLEVKIGKEFKEIDIWSPDEGVIYDTGCLLGEYAGVWEREDGDLAE